MKTWMKMALITIVVGIAAVPLGQMLWPAPTGGEGGAISDTELLFFIMFSLYEGLALGFGVAFLIFGLPLVRRANLGSTFLTWGSYLSIAWFLISWWPHDGLHRTTTSMTNLLMIEYGFHLTLMASGVILALAFMRVARNALPTTERPVAARPASLETVAG